MIGGFETLSFTMSAPYVPMFSSRRVKRAYLFLIPFVLILILIHYGYDGFNKVYDYHTQNGSSLIFSLTNKNNGIDRNAISSIYPDYTIFPKNFKEKLPVSTTHHKNIKFNGSPDSVLTPEIANMNYTSHSISIFSSLNPGKSECNLINYHRDFEISDYLVLPDELIKLAKVLKYQLENEPQFQELGKFFEGDQIGRLLKKGQSRQHFYKFAGTSVWLEKHGVHLMISRVIFSQTGEKTDPQVSLLYAQIYDENWKELVDVELVLPITNADNERVYEKSKFPRFMPIPFYHNADKTKKRWYGPEDTRLLLVKNQYGENEPVIIFNSYHRKILKVTNGKDGDTKVRTTFRFYRSMFIGWLFQYQYGKLNTDGFPDLNHNGISYTKIKELRIEGQDRQRVEKNWTPFVDPSERNVNYGGRDDYIYLIYQWNNLKILKCELADFIDDSQSTCKLAHIDLKDNEEEVGPVRGGTELIPIQTNTERNLWIGFLRAHIKKCGCGGSVYRPNFLVLERIDEVFKLTYLSGSINFNIPVYGFKDFETVCAGREANALIPNGISMFDEANDYMTLALSVADQYNTIIHIQGVRSLVELLEHTWEGKRNSKQLSKQIDCVVEHATEVCKQYAEEHFRIGDSEAAKKKAEEERVAAEKAQKEKEEKEKLAKEKEEKEKLAKEKEEAEKQGEKN